MFDLNIIIQGKQDKFVEIIEIAERNKRKYSISKEAEKINELYSITNNQTLDKQKFKQVIEKNQD